MAKRHTYEKIYKKTCLLPTYEEDYIQTRIGKRRGSTVYRFFANGE